MDIAIADEKIMPIRSRSLPLTCAGKIMSATRLTGILILGLAAGCAGVKEAPLHVAARPVPVIVDSAPVEPNCDAVTTASPPRTESKAPTSVALEHLPPAPHQPVKTTTVAVGGKVVASAVPAPSFKTHSFAKAGQAPVKVPAAAPALGQASKKAAQPAVAEALEPPLDVAALVVRLRDTDAIGMFTKLALKNQVDDLLKQFRKHYQSGQQTNVTSLRQPYNLLLMKVLALIQDGDPPLARSISGSREAIWGILADREKFNASV